MNKVTKFGKKPSEHIQQALNALIKAEKPSSTVKPFMARYHYSSSSYNTEFDTNYSPEICFACLGGLAAIEEYKPSKRVLNKWNRDKCPTRSSRGKFQSIHEFEFALDSVRRGYLNIAFETWGLPEEEGRQFNRNAIRYHEEPSYAKRQIRQLIEDLQKTGY